MCLMGCARQHVSGHGCSRTRLWLRSVASQVFDCHRCHRWFHPPGGGAVDLGSTGICNCCPYPPVLVVLPGRCGRVCSGGIPTGCGRKGSGDMIMVGWDGIDLTLLVCACLSACSPPFHAGMAVVVSDAVPGPLSQLQRLHRLCRFAFRYHVSLWRVRVCGCG